MPRRETAPYRAALGRVIRDRMDELELSQEEVAHRAEVDRTYLSGLELGSRNPTLETILRVARALDAAPSALLVGAEAAMRPRRR